MVKEDVRNTKYEILNAIKADRSGFTLIELMVSVALFSLIMILAANIFQSVINGQRDAIASRNIQESVRYSFEKLSKEIRMAQKDNAHFCIPAGNNIYWTNGGKDQLKFLNYQNKCVCYFLNNGQFMISDQTCAGGLPLTPQKIVVSNLKFQVNDSAASSQALVTLRMRVGVLVPGRMNETIDVQTSLSSRFYK